MYYLVYLTDRCNLFCRYCDSAGQRILHGHEIAYDFDRLIDFLLRDGDVSLKLYGGEPLLRVDLIEQLLARVPCRHVALQTNGTLLDQLPATLFEKIDVISLSLDGPADVTDFKRGRGTYDQVIAQARQLRRRGFRGPFDVRMTISPGVDIERSVRHFCAGRAVRFCNIHWQLTALFRSDEWGGLRAARVRDWFEQSYNPGISSLVRFWTDELVAGRYHRIVPFAPLIHDLITGDRVSSVRCGSGWAMWSIDSNGDIYPCPVMRWYPQHRLGNIADADPAALPQQPAREPCASCDLLGLCGGRCLHAQWHNAWGPAGFALVCQSIRHLLAELTEVAPIVEQLIAEQRLALDDLLIGGDYEKIP